MADVKQIQVGESTFDIKDEIARGIATTQVAGRVKPDGETITVTNDGTISAVGGSGGSGISVTATLSANGWSSNQQTVTFTGYTSSMGGVIGMPTSATDAQKEAYAEALINVVAQNGNQFTLECENVPSIDLPVTIYAGGSESGIPDGGTTNQVLAKNSNTDGDTKWMDVPSVAEVAAVRDNGAVNACPNDATTQVINGITWTVNADKTVTANGTATANSELTINISKLAVDRNKSYRLTGCPAGGSNDTFFFAASIYDGDTWKWWARDTGSGYTFTPQTGDLLACVLRVQSGVTVNNIIFKPMLSDAALNLSYSDYQPYAMTNRELTNVETLTVTISGTNIAGYASAVRCGKIVQANIRIKPTISVNVGSTIPTVTVSGIPLPAEPITFVSDALGVRFVIGLFNKDGTIGAKIYGEALPANTQFSAIFTYIAK